MKIIDVLNKIANGTLEDGAIVEYDDVCYKYDKEDDSLTHENNRPFSEDIIVEECLNDEVKLYLCVN